MKISEKSKLRFIIIKKIKERFLDFLFRLFRYENI